MERRPVAWAVFCSERTRLSASSSVVPAVSATEAVKLFLDVVDGIPFLSIEDGSLGTPTSIPFTNVASVGWLPEPKPAAKGPLKAKTEAVA